MFRGNICNNMTHSKDETEEYFGHENMWEFVVGTIVVLLVELGVVALIVWGIIKLI